jgi:NAD-dependent deacetylase
MISFPPGLAEGEGMDPQGKLRALVGAARRAVIFTGAGMSTDSGIPDFRSPSGLWTRMKPIPFDEFISSEAVRRESWRRRFEGDDTLTQATPNAGHYAVTALLTKGYARCVLTQNVDDLHRRAGVDPNALIELHGNSTYAACLSCGQRHELAALKAAFEATSTVPPCDACGGIVKSATISFGQAMPEGPMARAAEAIAACDLCLVLGSSLQVYPAAAFPEEAARRGVPLVIINREATPLDGLAELVWHEGIAEALAVLDDLPTLELAL